MIIFTGLLVLAAVIGLLTEPHHPWGNELCAMGLIAGYLIALGLTIP